MPGPVSDTVTQVNLKHHVPEGPVTEDAFDIIQISPPKADDLQDGDVLLKLVYVSVDPYMRTRFINKPGYLVDPFQPNQPIQSHAVGQILASKNPSYKENDFVESVLPWIEIQIVKNAQGFPGPLDKIDSPGLPLSYYIGTLGMPGMTAYSALNKIAQPKEGEVALVSGAAGAVGQLVVQMLKNVYKCSTVIAVAGGQHKTTFLKNELGIPHVIDYKTSNLEPTLKDLAPKGLDIYWDNVGGQTLETAIMHSARHMRIPVCGMISQYNLPPEREHAIKGMTKILWNRIRLEGFIVFDLWDEYYEKFKEDMPKWVKEGKIKVVEDVVKGGLKEGPRAFIGMMKGDNLGKMVVEVTGGVDPFRK